MSYSDNLSYQVADSRTMIKLLHLCDISNKCEDCPFSIVTEMLDLRNRELAEITEVDDFIVSDFFHQSVPQPGLGDQAVECCLSKLV